MDKDEFEKAKFLIEIHRGLHAQRKAREFRIVITLLSFYALLALAILKGEISSPPAYFRWLVAAACGGTAIAAFNQFCLHAKANKVSQRLIAEELENKILLDLGIALPKTKEHPMERMWLWQAWLILFGAALVGIIAWTEL